MKVRQSSRAKPFTKSRESRERAEKAFPCSTTGHKRTAVSMKAVLLITMLVSICLLQAEADTPDIPVHPDLDVQKLAGTWYPTAFALKNKKKEAVTVVDHTVEVSDNGDMILKMKNIKDGKCEVTERHVKHTDKPGIYNVANSSAIIHLVDVDYESYVILHVGWDKSYGLYLSTRKQDVSDDLTKKFKKLAKTLGFNKKKIFNEKRADKCPE